ncbi:hypothetical protein WIS52_11100 [Pseudonocardia nematodicida]|uniref:Uncharacterized protein n=1 Tax=Pseudonocardia nematodicida TaxID=1206997 RepID=A0ABV1K960_9PSEU
MSAPLDHEWETVSRHRSTDGVVGYQRCRCGARRIVLTHGGVHPGPDDAVLAEPGSLRFRAQAR